MAQRLHPQRHWIPPVALSIPHDPSRVAWAALSANGERQRLGGSGSRLLNAAVQSYTSPTTRSVVLLKDMMTSAACSDFGDLAAVVRACGGGELQVSGAGKPWSATAGSGGCFEALSIGAARVGVSEPCVITAGRGVGRRHRRNHALLPGLRAHVCMRHM